MRSLRIVIILAIISVIAIFVGSAARSYYKFLKEPLSPVINAVPSDASVIIKTKNVFHFFNAINNSVLSDLLGTLEDFTTINRYIDSITLNNPKLFNFLESNEVLFAIVPGSAEKMSLLFITSVGKSSLGTINNYIKSVLTDNEYSTIKINNHLYRLNHEGISNWYYIKQGVFAISNDSLVLFNSYNSLVYDSSIATNESFYKLYNTGGKKVDANIIVNTKVLAASLVPHLYKKLEKATPFDQWTTFDLNIKKSEVLFGGFTFTTSRHLFIGQEPVEFSELSDYPRNTAMAITLSLSDQELYSSHFFKGDTIHVKGFDSSIGEQNKEIFNRKKHINAWIGNSVSMIYTQDYFRGDNSGMIMMVRHSNADSARSYLLPYLEPQGDSIFNMHFASFPEKLWGSLFNMQGKLYCRFIGDHVIFSPSKRMLKIFDSENTLSNSKEFKVAKEWSGNSSNMFILLRPDVVGKWLNDSRSGSNRDLVNFFKENSSIGIQYSAGNDLQYTLGWLIPKAQNNLKKKEKSKIPNNKTDNKATELANADSKTDVSLNKSQETTDERIVKSKEKQLAFDLNTRTSTIQIVNGKSKNSKLISVIQSNGKINLLDNRGNKVWDYNAQGPIISKISEIDYYRNGRTQYLFSTNNKLIIIDQEGKEIKESPVRLPKAAKSEISVFDYDNKKEYRILYVGTDNRIYNITIQGLELPDWRKPVVSGQGKIEFHRTHGKDYITYKNIDGSIRIYDRRGKERIKVDLDLKLSKQTKLFSNTTNSKGIFISVSEKGELIYIDGNGKISKSNFGKFTNNPWFTYEDFDSDGSKDFIFAEDEQIIAFNRLKEKIAAINTKGKFGVPFVYASSSQDVWIFARNTKTNEITGINNKGKIYKGLSIKSNSDPIIFNPGGSMKEIMVTTRDNKLVLTELEGL